MKFLPAPEPSALGEHGLCKSLLVGVLVDPGRDIPQILHIRIPVQVLGDRVVDLQDPFLGPCVYFRRLPVEQLLRRPGHIGRVNGPPACKLLRRAVDLIQNRVADLFSVQGHASRIGKKRFYRRARVDNIASGDLFVLLQHVAEGLFVPDRPDRDPSLLGEGLSPHRFVFEDHVAKKVIRSAQDQLDMVAVTAGKHPADTDEAAGKIRIPFALPHNTLKFVQHEPELRVRLGELLIHLVIPVADAHALIRQSRDDLPEKRLHILSGRGPSDPVSHIGHALHDRLYEQILRHLFIVVKRHRFAGIREVLYVVRVFPHSAFAAEQDCDYISFMGSQIISDPVHDRCLSDPGRPVNDCHASRNDDRQVLFDVLPSKEHIRICDRALVIDIVPVKAPHLEAGIRAPDRQCFGRTADRFGSICPGLLPDRHHDGDSLFRAAQREPDPAARNKPALQAADAVNHEIVLVQPALLPEDDRNVLVPQRYRALSDIFDHEIDIAVRHRIIFVDNIDLQPDSLLQGLHVLADGAEKVFRVDGRAPLAYPRRGGPFRRSAMPLPAALSRRLLQCLLQL